MLIMRGVVFLLLGNPRALLSVSMPLIRPLVVQLPHAQASALQWRERRCDFRIVSKCKPEQDCRILWGMVHLWHCDD